MQEDNIKSLPRAGHLLLSWFLITTLFIGSYGWIVLYRTQLKGELQCFASSTDSSSNMLAWDKPGKNR